MTHVAEQAAAARRFVFDEIGLARWWTRSAAIDAAVTARFAGVWAEWRGRQAADFLGTGHVALGAVILFDQFPRNMFRGQADAFATDPLALAITEGAIGRGLDGGLSVDERSILYMPLMHAEDLARQERAVALFEGLGLAEPARYARAHRDMIARFGRFPARNAALGRADRPGETEGIAESRGW